MRPLEGMLVVGLEQAVAAPLATRHLADLGARVIKIERPGTGDFARAYDRHARSLSSFFIWLNHSKESMTLDIKDPEGREILSRLLATADVVVQNLAPGAAERLGTDATSLGATHPRLVVCTISGYGSYGPFADRRAYDLLVQCETGLVSITGSPGEPAKVPISVADIAGGMYAFSGILGSLLLRERSNTAAPVDVNLFDALTEWMSQPIYRTAFTGRAPQRTGARHASIAPYGPFAVGDGGTVYLAVQNDREWLRLCQKVLGDEDIAKDPRFATNADRAEHVDELTAAVEARLAGRTGIEMLELLDRAAIANAELKSMDQVVTHPHLEERNRWCDVGSPVGPLSLLRPALSIGAPTEMGPVPALGEQTDSILSELGYDAASIDQLHRDCTV